MFRRPLRTFPFVGILALVFSSAAFANTYTVGPGSGTDFPDLPTAIAAAQPGDVLLVQAANYTGGFTLDKGLTIIGYGNVSIGGRALVSQIPALQRAAVVKLDVAGLSVDHCDGPVVLADLTTTDTTTISSSADVRLSRLRATVPPLAAAVGATISDSRVEITECQVTGSDPGYSYGYGPENGGIGILCVGASRVQASRSIVRGGDGRENFGANVYCGDGAIGILLDNPVELILAGGQVYAGAGYPNLYYTDNCCYDGDGAPAIANSGLIWYSAVGLHPSMTLGPNPCYCTYVEAPPIAGTPGTTLVQPPDPVLTAAGAFTSGTIATLSLRGPPGAHAVLAFGRRLEVVPDPTVRVETLVVATRTIDLGAIPSSGVVTFQINDLNWAPGTFLAAQGTTTLSTGEIRRTNSVPMVFR